MSGSCCYYACNSGLTNDLDKPTFINITAGPVWGITPCGNLANLSNISDQGERGSIICNAHINKIQVESVLFKGLGQLRCDAVILDPSNRCCPQSYNCNGAEQAVQQGSPKSFTLAVPPGVESFMISVVCYRNFRYSCTLGRRPNANNAINEIDTNSSYSDLYRFCWWIDITKSCMTTPVFALGPYRNFDFFNNPNLINQNVQNDDNNEDDLSSLNLTDNLITGNGTGTNTNVSSRRLGIKPFYVGISGSNKLFSSNLNSNINNYAAGSGGNGINNNIPNNLNSLTSANAPLANNLMNMNSQMCSTICASFNLSNKDKRLAMDGNLAQLNSNCNACLTLFVPCPRSD